MSYKIEQKMLKKNVGLTIIFSGWREEGEDTAQAKGKG